MRTVHSAAAQPRKMGLDGRTSSAVRQCCQGVTTFANSVHAVYWHNVVRCDPGSGAIVSKFEEEEGTRVQGSRNSWRLAYSAVVLLQGRSWSFHQGIRPASVSGLRRSGAQPQASSLDEDNEAKRGWSRAGRRRSTAPIDC
jgi:hypothetical protein